MDFPICDGGGWLEDIQYAWLAGVDDRSDTIELSESAWVIRYPEFAKVEPATTLLRETTWQTNSIKGRGPLADAAELSILHHC